MRSCCYPSGGGLSTAAVFAEADRLGLGRSESELDELARRLREAAGARRLAARVRRAARQRPRAGGALAATRDRRGARRPARGRRPAGLPDRLGTHRRRPLPHPGRGEVGRGAARPRRRDRLRGGAGAVKMQLPENRRDRRLLIALIAAAIAAGYYLLSRVIPHDELQGLLEDVSNTLGAWTYLLVGVFAFAETGAFVGLVVPGETVMLLGGAVAGQGAISIYLLIAIAWFAAWAGDTTSFFLGRRLGREFVMRNGPRFGISHERFEKVEDYFSRHGGKTIFIGRFISLVRAFAPFIAGSSGMRYRAFVPYSILGTGLWASAHILIGYFFSRSIDTAAKYAGQRRLPARHADRRRRRRGPAGAPLPGRGEPARRGALDGGTPGHPLDRRPDAPLPAAARLPLGPGDAGRHLRARIHLADGDLRRRRLRPRRLHGDRQRRPRAHARRRHRDGNRRKAAHRLARRPGQGGDGARLERHLLAAGRDRRGGPRRPPPLGRARRARRSGWRSSSSASTRSRTRSTGPGPTTASSPSPAPPSPAPTPPTRPSTSGWR